MSIEEQIAEWALSRPPWQRVLLRRIAQGENIPVEQFAPIADGIIHDKWGEEESVRVEDMPTGIVTGRSVRFLEIRNARHVNALVGGQQLTFEPSGMTVVYGDNGSGKSGYARLIKQMVRPRHQEPILTDIFTDPGSSVPAAEVVVQIDGDRVDLNWPLENPAELAHVAFVDEACADAYITSDSEVSYRPSALFLLDGLIRVCDGVRGELDKRIIQTQGGASQFPTLHTGTRAARFLESLSAHTSEDQLQLATQLPPDIGVEIARLAAEEARLRATDPSKEKKRLQTIAAKLSRLATHLSSCGRMLGEMATERLRTLRANLARKQQAAALASTRSFDGEPVRGVGSPAWRDLWEAARRFATEACPEHEFPVTGPGAKCLLCHQELPEDAADRLKRFEAFIQDTTQRDLDAATEQWQQAHKGLVAFSPEPADVLAGLDDLAEEHTTLVQEYRRAIHLYATRHDELVQGSRRQAWEDPSTIVPSTLAYDPDTLSKQVQAAASTVDESTFAKELQAVSQARLELEATGTLASIRQTVLAEIQRLRILAKLDVAKESTDTRGISRKAADLTREYVTSVVRDRFTRESDRLKLERVTLEDIGARKGSLRHQPAFVGAIQKAELPKVLSEGERTALGLAGFFTEAHFDSSKSAMVLDDPVSSLDHVRRGCVAARLVEFAKDRQVIVFTHDIAFVADLRVVAERETVRVSERSVERRLSGEPGICHPAHPWKARDVGQRLQQLAEEAARIRRERITSNQQTYERETADWAGKLSETWERMINLEIVGQVVDRGTQEVRPRMFRLLARITEEDDREFQASYARCSRWARRHDKSVEVNYVPPGVDEMDAELDKVRTWYERVRKYRS